MKEKKVKYFTIIILSVIVTIIYFYYFERIDFVINKIGNTLFSISYFLIFLLICAFYKIFVNRSVFMDSNGGFDIFKRVLLVLFEFDINDKINILICSLFYMLVVFLFLIKLS